MKVIDFAKKHMEKIFGSDDPELEEFFYAGKVGDYYVDLEPYAQQHLNELNTNAIEFSNKSKEIYAVFEQMRTQQKSPSLDAVLKGEADEKSALKRYYKAGAKQIDGYSKKLSIHMPSFIENRKSAVEMIEILSGAILENDNPDILTPEVINAIKALQGQVNLMHQNMVRSKEFYKSLHTSFVDKYSDPDNEKMVVFKRATNRFEKLLVQIVDVYTELESDYAILKESFSNGVRELNIV